MDMREGNLWSSVRSVGWICVFWHPIGIERINGFENKDNLLRLRGTDIVNVLKERLTD